MTVLSLLYLCLLLCCLVGHANGTGELSIKLVSINSYGKDKNGGGCDSFIFSSPCDLHLDVCIRYGHTTDNFNCGSSGVLWKTVAGEYLNSNSVTFGDNLNGNANPRTTATSDTFNGNYEITVYVQDIDPLSNEHIDTIYIRRRAYQSNNGAFSQVYIDYGTRSSSPIQFKTQHKLICDNNYYGDFCTTECVAMDNADGHYTCETYTGNLICNTGWQGSSCNTAICKSGCLHGTCNNLPNACNCDSGWTGQTCATCIPTTGCVHGYCNAPNQCICESSYEGALCNLDTNYCGNNPSPCVHGSCVNEGYSYRCDCEPKYQGAFCNVEKNACLFAVCLNAGTCINLGDDFNCSCVTGYGGRNCEIDIDECAGVFCGNGTCVDDINSYMCSCFDGYTGDHCEDFTNECEPVPCQNQGTCLDMFNGYICQCAAEFTGRNCENNISSCQPSCPNPCDYTPSICLNTGNCDRNGQQYTCNCLEGYFGDNCGDLIDSCISNQCVNGQCVDLPGDTYKCFCDLGYEGSVCDSDVDKCALGPCANGTCVNLFAQYQCNCDVGFTGQICNEDVDWCAMSLCSNNAICLNFRTHYACQCAPGFSGVHCSINVNDCKANSCLNNGSCVDGINSFTCSCASGFTGDHCETDIDECETSLIIVRQMNGTNYPNVCGFYGSCEDMLNGYVCTCDVGYTGQLCEIDIDDCMSNPCPANSNCTDRVNSYECTCFDDVPRHQDTCEIISTISSQVIGTPAQTYIIYAGVPAVIVIFIILVLLICLIVFCVYIKRRSIKKKAAQHSTGADRRDSPIYNSLPVLGDPNYSDINETSLHIITNSLTNKGIQNSTYGILNENSNSLKSSSFSGAILKQDLSSNKMFQRVSIEHSSPKKMPLNNESCYNRIAELGIDSQEPKLSNNPFLESEKVYSTSIYNEAFLPPANKPENYYSPAATRSVALRKEN